MNTNETNTRQEARLEPVVGRFTDADYLQFDPFEGDRDVDIRNHTVKMVTTRKPHRCAMPTGPREKQHTIPAGSRARYESAIVDGEWGSYHVCMHCMDKWLIDERGLTPRTDAAVERMDINHTPAWPKKVEADFARDLEREIERMQSALRAFLRTDSSFTASSLTVVRQMAEDGNELAEVVLQARLALGETEPLAPTRLRKVKQ